MQPVAPRAPWQNAYVERMTGSVSRVCLDHVIVLNERHLRRILKRYLDHYHDTRTYLTLAKEAPMSRPVSVGQGTDVPFPNVAGLHHRYKSIAT
ncbi:MAG: integrase core domain-containing protein [Geminicoccales bacterium]